MADWLPEDIRGGWYRVPANADPEEVIGEEGDVLTFDLDGQYRAYEIEDGRRQESEIGGFTFDGSFLILRGGSTETYRVEPKTRWHLELETKSDEFWMLRGLFDPAEIDGSISSEQVAEIRRMPAKVLVRSAFDGPEAGDIVTFLDESTDADEPALLGAGCRQWESEDHSSLWVGVTPTVEALEAEAWRAIVHEAFLDVYLGGPDSLETVTLQLFHDDAPDRLEFRYD